MLTRRGFIRRRLVRPLLLRMTRRLLNVAGVPLRFEDVEFSAQVCAASHLRSLYPELAANGGAANPLTLVEAKVYSQHGEDGVIAYLFSKIGATNRRFIEFGVEDGRECNTANLSLHFGWSGLLIEGDADSAARARAYYNRVLRSDRDRVQVAHSFITAENINTLFEAHGMAGEIDFLSVDIDGADYWVWKAITVVAPRVVCVEYNSSFGPERSVTVAYDPAFERYRYHPSGLYYGASLTALTKLAREKGYILAGCESQGVNAFFVRADAAQNRIAEITPEAAFIPQRSRHEHGSVEEQFRVIQHLPLVSV